MTKETKKARKKRLFRRLRRVRMVRKWAENRAVEIVAENPGWTEKQVGDQIRSEAKREWGDGKLLELLFNFLKWLLPMLMAL